MNSKMRLVVSSAMAAIVFAASGPAFAQGARAAAEASDSSGDIIVTAQRRSEKLQDVPASITALSSEMLERSGITQTTDIARVTPGVTMTFFGGFLQPSIRGITSTGANIGENANVVMYIDGVYQPQQIATLMDLPDVEQIEVLKGPQGALYGQNALGGAILVNSKAPSFDTTGKFSASYGNFNDIQLRGYISGPLGEKVAVSLSGAYQDRDGFRRHVVTGQRDLGLSSHVVRGKILFEPADSAKITVTGYYSSRNDSATFAGFAINRNSIGSARDLTGLLGPGFGPFFPIPAHPSATSPDQFESDPGVFTLIKSYGGNIRGEFDIGGGKVTSTTGYFKNNIRYLADIDASAVHIGQATAEPLTGKFFVQDLNFASAEMGIVSFQAGGFFLSGNEEFGFNGFDGIVPVLPPAAKNFIFSAKTTARVEKRIIAGYAEITLKPTEQLTLTAGGRYTSERLKTFSGLFGAATIPEYPRGPVTFNKFTPRVTARYAVSPDINVYASWGRGFKSGVVNTTDFTLDPVKPETIDAFEVGIKGRAGSAFRFSLASFYYNYKNLQAVKYAPPSYITQNAASARSQGFEFDMYWDVTPEFTLSGGASIIDAKYVKFPGAATFQATGTGNLNIIEDLSGKPLLRAPKFSGNIAANYSTEFSAGKLSAFAALYYNSGFGLELSHRLKQAEFATADAELAFEPSGLKGTRFVVWGKNLSDKAVYAVALASSLADLGSYAPPRTFGIRAEYSF